MNILIVDDEPAMREMMRMVLQQQGHYTTCCSGGKEALDLIGNIPCDVVIADVRMPEMTGYELCERIVADEITNRIPVILYSGILSGELDWHRAADVGAARLIEKSGPGFSERIRRVVAQVTIADRSTKAVSTITQGMEHGFSDIKADTSALTRAVLGDINEPGKLGLLARVKNLEWAVLLLASMMLTYISVLHGWNIKLP